MTFLEKGNKALVNKDYQEALNFYNKAIKENPVLQEILEFNVNLALRELVAKGEAPVNCTQLSSKSDKEKKAIIKAYLEYKKKRRASVAVYMAITGGYDNLILPDELVFDWDYVLFTDAEVEGVYPFDVRRPATIDYDTVRTARYHKLNPHKVLSEYKYTIWIDGNIQLKSGYFRQLIEEEIQLKTKLLMRQHPDRNCTYDEIMKCRELLKDDFGLMSRQLAKYESEGFARNNGLYETNVIFRDNQDNQVKYFNEVWWNELSKWSRRDQLSCVYALKKANINPALFPEDVDIRDSNNKYYALFPHSQNLSKKLKSYKPESCYKFNIKSNSLKNSFQYNISNKSYSLSKAPYKPKRAFLNARNLSFYQEGIKELKALAKNSNKKERNWASWLLGMLLADLEGTKDRADAEFYLSTSDLHAECPGFDIYKKFMLNELGKGQIPIVHDDELEKDVDLLSQAISFELTLPNKIKFFNAIFEKYGLQRVRVLGESNSYLDNLYPESPIKRGDFRKGGYKVTIIIPCYKCSHSISTTLYSLMMQTWLNLEIILVDDCSPDDTHVVLEKFARLDNRIKVIQTDSNSGPYVARNAALNLATGDLVTVCDSDDWCHPEKIEYQVRHFELNSDIVANCASWVRCDERFNFIRRGQPFYKHLNISSLMFKREEVLNVLGGWDEVRFAADGEFYKRLIKAFGKNRVCELDGVTSIGRVELSSLTNNSFFGYDGFPYGARLEYLQSYEYWHQMKNGVEHLFYDIDNEKRCYPVPRPMLPSYVSEKIAKFDTVIAGDLRDPEIENVILDLIYKEESSENSWTLVQVSSPKIDARLKVSTKIRSQLTKYNKCLSVYGEQLNCQQIYFVENGINEVYSSYLPKISANELSVIVCSKTEKFSLSNATLFTSLGDLFDFKTKRILYFSSSVIPQDVSKDSVDFLFEEIVSLNMSELDTTELRVSPSISIVMPCIDEELGHKTAQILSSRAGTGCTVIIAMDDMRGGFMSTLNSVAAKCNSRFIVFVAQDAFPGRDWLKIALERIENEGAGLLAFNDGKWFGRIASFGMVRKSWIKKFYENAILNPYYKAHKADNEITVLAKLDGRFVYEPNSTLIEVDYRKDAGGSNPEDDERFRERFNNQLTQFFPKDRIESFRKEYKVKKGGA